MYMYSYSQGSAQCLSEWVFFTNSYKAFLHLSGLYGCKTSLGIMWTMPPDIPGVKEVTRLSVTEGKVSVGLTSKNKVSKN